MLGKKSGSKVATFIYFITTLFIFSILTTSIVAKAREYVNPDRYIAYNNKRYERNSDALKSAYMKDFCVKGYGEYVCTLEFGPDVWTETDNNFNKWHWTATFMNSYLGTSTSTEPTVVRRTGLFGYVSHQCPETGGWTDNQSTQVKETQQFF